MHSLYCNASDASGYHVLHAHYDISQLFTELLEVLSLVKACRASFEESSAL